MKLYHYSSTKFDLIDMNKCDGFWMTTIAPHEFDLLNEIGADGLDFVAVVEFDDSGEDLMNTENYNVAENLEAEQADYIRNEYDGFTDYATTKVDLINIVEWLVV